MTVIGTVELRDWDEGCMLTLGAEIATYAVDGDTRQIYACSVPGLNSGFSELSGKVPCQFQDPEGVYQPYRIPCFQFRQNDLAPAFDRQPWYSWVGRAPSKDAEEVTLSDGTTGYTKYDNQWRPSPFDITYECIVIARRRQEVLLMLQYALTHFMSPWFVFKVVDSKGDVRQYDAGDISISNVSELADIAERTVSYNISFTVRAEVDLHDIKQYSAMTDHRVTYNVFTPAENDEVNDAIISDDIESVSDIINT